MTKDQTLIAVVLPVYNGRDFLADAIDSVVAQTYSRWCLIIVNDGSIDDSADIAARYAANDSRISVVTTPNRGLSAARNEGVAIALRRHIGLTTFLDADDKLHPRALETMLPAMTADVDLVVAGASMRADAADAPLPDSVEFAHPTPEGLVEETLYQRGALHAAWSKIYRTGLLDSNRFTEGLYYEDLDFFYRYCLSCRHVAVTYKPLYYYRQHAASIMHTWHARRLDVLKITARIEDEMELKHRDLLKAARDRRLSANFNIFILASRNHCKVVADECWRLVRRYRLEALLNPKVRFKNKAGAALSYLGRRIFSLVSSWAGM